MASFREVLFKKNFFSLWASQIISEFGDRLNQMALLALVYSKSPGSVVAVAKLFFFIVVPVFVIGPLAGVYVDRWDRKRVMIIADLFRGLLVLVIPVFIALDMMVPIYIAVFLMFSATRFFLPSKLAIIPSIVPEDKLMVANSLSNSTRMIATVVGFAAAGFIVKWVGHIWGFYLDSVSYFISAALLAVITPKERLKAVREELHMTREIIGESIRKNVWGEIVEGFGHMVKKDRMKVVTSVLFLLMAGAGSIFCVVIVFIQEAFGSVTKDLGMFGIFLGAGLFLGTVVYGKAGNNWPKIRTMLAGFVMSGAFITLFALYAGADPTFIIGGVLIALVGAAAAPIFTCSNTLIHTIVPDDMHGKVFSSVEAVMHLAFLVFMFLTAFLSRHIANRDILLASGIIFAVIGLAGLGITRVGGTKD